MSEALKGDLFGVAEVDEALWQVWFGPAETALKDAAESKLWPLVAAASGLRRGR